MALFGGQFYKQTSNTKRNRYYLKFCLVSSPVIRCMLKAICMYIKLFSSQCLLFHVRLIVNGYIWWSVL